LKRGKGVDKVRIFLEGHKREFHFPLPVRSISYDKSGYLINCPVNQDIIQFGLRLNCDLTYVHNIIDGKKYKNSFPHVNIKLPLINNYVEQDAYCEILYFTYNKNLFSEFEKRKLLTDTRPWEFSLSPRINNLIVELRYFMENFNIYGNADRINLFALTLLQELILNRDMKYKYQTNTTEAKIQKIASYFNVHYKDNIDFEAIALKQGMSLRTFFRQWKKYFDTTPSKYLSNLKQKEAEILLIETNFTIEEISDMLNLNFAYFCGVFKKEFGMTPLQYRTALSTT
jgi:AraC-like DNA-binding protein